MVSRDLPTSRAHRASVRLSAEAWLPRSWWAWCACVCGICFWWHEDSVLGEQWCIDSCLVCMPDSCVFRAFQSPKILCLHGYPGRILSTLLYVDVFHYTQCHLAGSHLEDTQFSPECKHSNRKRLGRIILNLLWVSYQRYAMGGDSEDSQLERIKAPSRDVRRENTPDHALVTLAGYQYYQEAIWRWCMCPASLSLQYAAWFCTILEWGSQLSGLGLCIDLSMYTYYIVSSLIVLIMKTTAPHMWFELWIELNDHGYLLLADSCIGCPDHERPHTFPTLVSKALSGKCFLSKSLLFILLQLSYLTSQD